MSITLAPPAVAGPEDEIFTISGLTWDQYITINNSLGERAGLRVLYVAGRMTFVSPALIHEGSEDNLDSIIKAVAIACRLPLRPIGSTTLRKEGVQVGIEGDRVYYLGENVGRMHGVQEIDLQVHPTPDLAVEVENSRKATDAMAIYARMGVPEVWRHDARRGTLGFWCLQADATYSPSVRSVQFPFLTPDDVLLQIRRAEEYASYSDWFPQLLDWARDVIAPRLDQR
jgi:Uma2 family endonuclease